MTSNILQLLTKLISFESVTPKGKDALEFIANFLQKLGFECIIEDFGPTREVSNLYAVYGDSAPNICFAGHVDVVPPLNEDAWKFNPYKATIENDKIYGRGVVDMKGAIACALDSVEKIINSQQKIKGSISFLLTTDEEGPGTYGTIKMLEYIDRKYPKIDLCILGEPTSKKEIGDTIKIGRRGSINFNLTVKGRQGHVAYPEKALNPVYGFNKILNDLNSLKLDSGNDFFQSSNLEITSISTGEDVSNVIPESVNTKFNIRFNDIHTKKGLNNIIDNIVKSHSKNYNLSYTCSSLPFIQEVSEDINRCFEVIKKSCKVKPKLDTNGGTSDSRFIHKHSEVIELGLKSDEAHKINEHCEIYDLQILANMYSMLLVEFLLKEV